MTYTTFHLLDNNNQGERHSSFLSAQNTANNKPGYDTIHEVSVSSHLNNGYLMDTVHVWERKNNIWSQIC